jgi:hypothetical protein
MAFESTRSGRSFGTRPNVGETATDYQARLAHEQEEMRQRRLADLAEQVSVRNTPSERILIWERLHEVPLPRNPVHKLLSVIAAATDLKLEQVQEEQRLRLVAARGVSAEPGLELPEI